MFVFVSVPLPPLRVTLLFADHSWVGVASVDTCHPPMASPPRSPKPRSEQCVVFVVTLPHTVLSLLSPCDGALGGSSGEGMSPVGLGCLVSLVLLQFDYAEICSRSIKPHRAGVMDMLFLQKEVVLDGFFSFPFPFSFTS